MLKHRAKSTDVTLMPVTMLLADDHRMVRESLKRSFVEHGFQVVGEADDGRKAVELAAELRPNVVLMDITMPQLDGIAACEEILHIVPTTRVIMLTMHHDEELLARSIRAGACGFLVKDCSVDELVTATRLAANGETVIAPQLKSHLLAQVRRSAAGGSPAMGGGSRALTGPGRGGTESGGRRVTRRESEVLQLIADGCSTTEVASRLYISQKTVKNHLASIYQKLDARDRTQAVLLAVRQGIVTLE